MKKVFSILFILLIVGSFIACKKDDTPPTVVLSNLPESPINSTSINIIVENESVEKEGIAEYMYKIDNGSWSPATSASIPIVSFDITEGEHTIYVIGSDSNMNWQLKDKATTHTWIVDITPPVAEISNTPPILTNSTQIDVNVYGEGVTNYRYKLDNNAWSTEKSVESPIVETGMEDGWHELYVVGKDEAGNWQSATDTAPYEWEIDSSKPIGSFVINGDADYTTDLEVTLDLSNITEATDMRFANNSTDIAQASWIDYTSSYSWALDSAGGSVKTVYAQFRDAIMNISDTLSDDITYDPNAPGGLFTIQGSDSENLYTDTVNVTLNLSQISNADKMRFSNEVETLDSKPWENFDITKEWELDPVNGTKTVYAEFKKSTTGLNNSIEDTIILDTIRPAVMNIYPKMDSTIIVNQPEIIISFSETMDIINSVIKGSIIEGLTEDVEYDLQWSNHGGSPNDTLTLTLIGDSEWNYGNGRILDISEVVDLATNDIALSETTYISYDVVNEMFVSISSGDDSYIGSPQEPYQTIQKAISEAQPPTRIKVAEGIYNVNTPINMIEQVSLYGGYEDVNWTRDIIGNVTTIKNTVTTGGDDISPNSAVYFVESNISNRTVLDGFTLEGGDGDYSSGVFCLYGSEPVITNCIINGGNGTSKSYGVRSYAASPNIYYCEINGGNGYDSYGVSAASGSSSVIANNTIHGGTGTNSTGLSNSFSLIRIVNNTIYGGDGTVKSCGVFNWESFPNIINNIIFTSFISESYGIDNRRLDGNGTSRPTALFNNNFFECNYLYRKADDTDTTYTDITMLNSDLDIADANVNVNNIFVDQANGDWHLQSGATNFTLVAENGLDLSGESYFPLGDHDNDDSTPETATDKDNTERTGNGTTGWSMGAYEY